MTAEGLMLFEREGAGRCDLRANVVSFELCLSALPRPLRRHGRA
jgi:hypothetical protein